MPLLFLALSVACSGAVSNGTPSAQTITLAVTPSSVTIRPSAAAAFVAQVYGTGGPKVNWSVEPNGGSIDADGNYTAPSTPGVYRVTASVEGGLATPQVVTVYVMPPDRVPVAVGAEYFVATSGDDSNPGTVDQPFLTLERAQAAVRALRSGAGLPAAGVAVTLRGGAYYRKGALMLGAADSGTASSPVIWRAYAGETPRIIGGQRVTNWTAVRSDDPNWSRVYTPATLYKAKASFQPGDPVPSANSAIPELSYRGVLMQRGRWPNNAVPAAGGGAAIGAAAGHARASALTGNSITAATSLPHDWSRAALLADANKPWIWITRAGIGDQSGQIARVSGSTIGLQNITWGQLSVNPDIVALPTVEWIATNLLEEVDEPGEYWIDRIGGDVYFRPPDDINPDASGGEAVVSAFAEALIQLGSTSSYITIDGLTLESAQRNALNVAGSHNTVANTTIKNAGASGAWIAGSSHLFDRNTIYATGFLGLGLQNGANSFGSVPDADILAASSGVTVTNNDISRGGRLFYSGGSLFEVGGRGHTIRNNYVHDGPATGMWLHGGHGSLIELNEFARVPNHGADGGTIYCGTDLGVTGITIQHNYFHDVARPDELWGPGGSGGIAAIYFDDDTAPYDHCSGFTVKGNIIYRYGDGTSCNPSNSSGRCGLGTENKSVGNVYLHNLFARVDTPYVSSNGGSSVTFSNNQQWVTFWPKTFPVGPGNVTADPRFDREPTPLSNDGSSSFTNVGTEAIPWSAIGIRPQ